MKFGSNFDTGTYTCVYMNEFTYFIKNKVPSRPLKYYPARSNSIPPAQILSRPARFF